MHPVRISADYWLRWLIHFKVLLSNRRRNVGTVPSNKFRCQTFKLPYAPICTPTVSRDSAAVAAIKICSESGCMRFSSMYCSNYAIRLHSPYLKTHYKLFHSARRHASHATNTLLLHVEVLLVKNREGGGVAEGETYILNAFFKTAFSARIIAVSFIPYHAPQAQFDRTGSDLANGATTPRLLMLPKTRYKQRIN
jgi:hypothetical protein